MKEFPATVSLATYTAIHVVLSLVGIGSGFVVMTGLFSGRRLDGWTLVFWRAPWRPA